MLRLASILITFAVCVQAQAAELKFLVAYTSQAKVRAGGAQQIQQAADKFITDLRSAMSARNLMEPLLASVAEVSDPAEHPSYCKNAYRFMTADDGVWDEIYGSMRGAADWLVLITAGPSSCNQSEFNSYIGELFSGPYSNGVVIPLTCITGSNASRYATYLKENASPSALTARLNYFAALRPAPQISFSTSRSAKGLSIAASMLLGDGQLGADQRIDLLYRPDTQSEWRHVDASYTDSAGNLTFIAKNAGFYRLGQHPNKDISSSSVWYEGIVRLSLESQPASTGIRLIARVSDPNGVPLSGKVVRFMHTPTPFSWDFASFANLPTDSAGQVESVVTDLGRYRAQIYYEENWYTYDFAYSNEVEHYGPDTNLSLTSKMNSSSTLARLTGKFKTKSGGYIGQSFIELWGQANSESAPALLAGDFTNYYGEVSFTANENAKYFLRSRADARSSQSVSITVAAPPTPIVEPEPQQPTPPEVVPPESIITQPPSNISKPKKNRKKARRHKRR